MTNDRGATPDPLADDTGETSDATVGASRRGTGSLEWALRAQSDSSLTAADWLAEELVPGCEGAVAILSDPRTPPDALRRLKDGFKAMRVLGEHTADRRLGARLYLAAIAAAIAYHGERISTQSDAALRDALTQMRDDAEIPDPLRTLAVAALRRLDQLETRSAKGSAPRRPRTGLG